MKNAKKPKNFNELKSEESDSYFLILENEINDIETSHEGNYEENYEENLEENFEQNFEENVEEKFEKYQEENLEEKFEEPYFKENLKLNRRLQINSKKDDNHHNDDNRPPPEPPPINFEIEKIITRKNIFECCDQLTMHKDNYIIIYLLQM